MRDRDHSRSPSKRAASVFWLILATAYLLFSGIYSYLAPCGSWWNQIFGGLAWLEIDPGAFYVAGAHQLAWGETQLLVGHPGATLLLLLLGIQRGYYALIGSEGLSFAQFTARNLPTVFLLSKLLMTSLHLVSFYAVFAFARRIVGGERAAFWASLGYATSFPVLYYLSRISVEPLMVIFFVAAFLAMWRYQELAVEGRLGGSFGFVGLAAGAAISGAVTKLSFLGPLPFFLAAYILAGARREGSGNPIGWRVRALALLVFGVVGITLTLLYSQIIDWHRSFEVFAKLARAPSRLKSWTPGGLLPSPTPAGIFLMSELAFIAMGTAGWIVFLRRHLGQRSRTLWVSAYAGYGLLLWAYRVANFGSFLPFHYFFLPQVVLAVFFGHFSVLVLDRIPVRSTGWRLAALGLVWVGSIHGVGAWAVVDSRRHDASEYAPNRSTYALISRLKPSERLGLEPSKRREHPLFEGIARLHGIHFPLKPGVPTSELRREFEALFTLVDPSTVGPNVRRFFVPALDRDVVILDVSEPVPDPQRVE